MADLEEAGLSLVVEGGNAFESEINSAQNAAESFGSGMESVGSGIDAVGEVITGALRAVGEIAVTSLLAAGGAVMDFLGDSFAGALEAEETMARLGQVIESTGGIAGVTVADAEALADEFKNLAGGSDDAVISIIDMGLRMGTISEEMMPDFIQSTLDLGAVMGDAGKASQLMARAVEDPVGVLGALRKAGILVNETTEAQIKAMVAAGDTAGAYSLLMDRVGEATEGAAETMAMTTAGQWTIFQETIADAGETIVGAFLPAIMSIGGPIMETVVPAISAFASGLGTQIPAAIATAQAFFQPFIDSILVNLPIIQTTFTTVWTSIQGVLTVLSEFFTVTFMPALASIWEQTGIQLPTTQQTFESVMAGIVVAVQLVSDFITNVLVPVLTAAVDWVVTNWPMIQATATEVWAQVQAAIQTAVTYIQGILDAFLPQMTANVQTTLTGLTAFWDEHGSEIMAIVSNAFTSMMTFIGITLGLIGATVTTSLTLLSGLFAATMQIVNGDWSGAWTTIQETIVSALDGILAFVDTDLASFTSVWTDNWNNAILIITTAWNNIVTGITSGISNLLTIIGTAVYNIGNAFVSIDWTAFGAFVIDGIRNGIASAVGGLVQSAVDAAMAAYNAARAALGMGSPSKLFMDIGENTQESEALGIEKKKHIPAIASAKAALGMVPPADSFGYSGSRVPAPPVPAFSPPAFSGGPATGSPVTISIDARGASPTETQRAVTHALQAAGQYSDTRLRLRGAM